MKSLSNILFIPLFPLSVVMKLIGDGMAVQQVEGAVVAPFDCKVNKYFQQEMR